MLKSQTCPIQIIGTKKNDKSNPTQEIVFNLREAYYRLKAEKEAEREFRAKEA